MLGLTIAGAGIMKSESAITKQKEQEAKKSQELANLQAQQSAQKADATANWEENLAMQAEAKQIVMTQVTQSQANKEFWSAYAVWKEKVTLAGAKRQAQALLLTRKKDNKTKEKVRYSKPTQQKNIFKLGPLAKLGLALTAIVALFSIVSTYMPTQNCEMGVNSDEEPTYEPCGGGGNVGSAEGPGPQTGGVNTGGGSVSSSNISPNSVGVSIPSNYTPIRPTQPNLYRYIDATSATTTRYVIRLGNGIERIIPEGWSWRVADNGKGIVFQQPGSYKNANSIRIMDVGADPRYPDGYIRIYNSYNQAIDINGSPSSSAFTHFQLNQLGEIPWPTP